MILLFIFHLLIIFPQSVFFEGPGIKQNYEFTAKVRNMDMVPTAMYVLGLQPSLWWEGTIMREAFEESIMS